MTGAEAPSVLASLKEGLAGSPLMEPLGNVCREQGGVKVGALGAPGEGTGSDSALGPSIQPKPGLSPQAQKQT